MSYLETQRRHLRLSILKLLGEAPGYRCNDSILRDSLEPYGFDPTRDQVRAELAWLSANGLVDLTEMSEGRLIVAKVTGRGLDVCEGRLVDPGVQRPAA